MKQPSAELYVEVQTFFARQMRLLYARDLEGYVGTFTEDGVLEHASRGDRQQGRAELLASLTRALPHYRGVMVRHWYDKLVVEPADDGSVQVEYYALVSRTDSTGAVHFEPTFSVTETLVREDGALRTRRRVITRDTPSDEPLGVPAP